MTTRSAPPTAFAPEPHARGSAAGVVADFYARLRAPLEAERAELASALASLEREYAETTARHDARRTEAHAAWQRAAERAWRIARTAEARRNLAAGLWLPATIALVAMATLWWFRSPLGLVARSDLLPTITIAAVIVLSAYASVTLWRSFRRFSAARDAWQFSAPRLLTDDRGRHLVATARAESFPALACTVTLSATGVVSIDAAGGTTAERLMAPLRLTLAADPTLRNWLAGPGDGLASTRGRMADMRRRLGTLQQSLERMARAETAFRDVFLPSAVAEQVLASLHLHQTSDQAAPAGTLLYGPPGTGKTEIARTLARAAGMAFVGTSGGQLKSGHVGGTEERVRELWKHAREQRPCILFVDECDACFPDRAAPGIDPYARSMTESFLAEWQGLAGTRGIWVVGATNARDRIDPAILSRFGEAIEIGLPDAAARAGILARAFREAGIAGGVGDELVAATVGMSGRDLTKVAAALRRLVVSQGHANTEAPPTRAQLAAAIASIRGRASTAVDPAAGWSTLILPEETRRALRTMTAMLQNVETLRRQNISVPRSLLLYGPPGTGKTQIARTLAAEAGLAFIASAPSDLRGEYAGHTAPKVRALFERARASAPAILFVDEIDAVAAARGGGDRQGEELVAQLLQELDGVARDDRSVFLIAATNRRDALDPAVLSRFAERIEVGLPTVDARREILRTLLAGKPLAFADRLEAVLDAIARRTDGWSGRELRSLVESAERSAVARAAESDALAAVTIADHDFAI